MMINTDDVDFDADADADADAYAVTQNSNTWSYTCRRISDIHGRSFTIHKYHSKSLSTIFSRRAEMMLTIGSRRCPSLSSLLEK